MISWVGWTKYESTYPYGDPRALGMMGDYGQGYGMYGFDYEHGLVPMMQFCVNHSSRYSAFQTYIDYGVGDPRLVNNSDLHNLFILFGINYTNDFLWCQNQCYINDYLNPALAIARSYNLDNLDDPYVIGSLGSMAIRAGAFSQSLYGNAVRAMVGISGVIPMLTAGYQVFDNYYYPLGDDRWRRQMAECFADMANDEDLADITDTGGRSDVRFPELKVWMMCRRRR